MMLLLRQMGVVVFGGVRSTTKRITRTALGGAVAAIFGLTAYVSLVLALGFYLTGLVGPVVAALIIAALTAICAAVVVVVVQAMNRRTELRMEARRRAAKARLPDPMTLQLLAGMPALLKGRSLLTVMAIAATVYGVAKAQGVGRDPHDGGQ
jgi:hypothetical protein